jgi:hypothetical protein
MHLICKRKGELAKKLTEKKEKAEKLKFEQDVLNFVNRPSLKTPDAAPNQNPTEIKTEKFPAK